MNAFRLLEKYREISNCFNDDIQGTASVVLAGIIASHKLTGKKGLADHRFLFLGAGEAGTGIADLISSAILAESSDDNTPIQSARERLWFVDSKGMICQERGTEKLEHHKLNYAHSLKATLDYDGPGKTNISLDHLCLFSLC